MAGRFPLFTDENIPGPVIGALRAAGWDIAHARELFGENTNDEDLLEYAASHGRVLVSTDKDHLPIANRWLREREQDPFRYPIYYLKPKA